MHEENNAIMSERDGRLSKILLSPTQFLHEENNAIMSERSLSIHPPALNIIASRGFFSSRGGAKGKKRREKRERKRKVVLSMG